MRAHPDPALPSRGRARRVGVASGLIIAATIVTVALSGPGETREHPDSLALSGMSGPMRTRAALPGYPAIKDAAKDSDKDKDSDKSDSGKKSGEKSDKKSSDSDDDKDSKSSKSGKSSSSASSSRSTAPSSSRSSADSAGGTAPGATGGLGPTKTPGANSGGGSAVDQASSTPAGPSGAPKPAPGTGARSKIACTRTVADDAGLKDALSQATPDDVICYDKTGTGSSVKPSATPSPAPPRSTSRALPDSTAPTSAAPSTPRTTAETSSRTQPTEEPSRPRSDSTSTQRGGSGGDGRISTSADPDSIISQVFAQIAELLSRMSAGGARDTASRDVPDVPDLSELTDGLPSGGGRGKVTVQTPVQTRNNTGGPSSPISVCGEEGTCQQTNRTGDTSRSSSSSGSPGSSSDSSSKSSGNRADSSSRPKASSSSRGHSAASSGTDSGDDSEGEQATTRPTSASSTASPAPGGNSAPVPSGECTKQVDGAQLASAVGAASPGDRICANGGSADRLEISKGGTPDAPIEIRGNGNAIVKGITVKADNVIVDGFQVLEAQAPGIEIVANGVTVSNNVVKHPTGGDSDGMRFFGNNLKILQNTISDINPGGGKAHADCMQTFTSGRPSSEHVIIDGNRCEKIANICLMAEGPGDVGDGGGGDGTSADWQYTNNYCEFGASQGLMIEAIQNVTIENNEFQGSSDKAIGLDIGATGAKVANNLVGSGIGHEVGMDATSKKDYQGPQPGGGP